jgi:predicted DNA-binding transcriptional regulator YafY
MRYQKGWGKGQPVEDLLVEPYRIAIMGGTWYLLAMDFNKHNQVLHQYKILNIREAKMTNEVFTTASGVDVQKILDNTFGQFIGDPNNLTKVRLRFSQRAAPLLTGRKFQANEQRKYIKEEDRTEITLTVARGNNLPYYHILSWILSWGGDAEVMEPADLRKAVADEARRIAAIYKKTTSPK